MKELVKPNANEDFLNEVSALCELECSQGAVPCNKHCSGQGTSNESVSSKDDEIIF